MRDWVGLWRKDRRCGPEFPLPDNSGPTQCNPDSEDKFCCSKWDKKVISSSLLYLFIFIDGASAAVTGSTVVVLSASTTETTSEKQRFQALELSEIKPSILTKSVIVTFC